MTKIKNIFWKIGALAMLAAPVTVMAQLQNTGELAQDTGLADTDIFQIIRNLMFWILGLLGFIAVIGFVISGIMYLVAAGDEDAQKRAKRAMYYSITGVIVGLIGLVILSAVENLLIGTRQDF